MPKLKCIDSEQPIDLFGDFNTPGSQMLSIFFASCDLLNVATCREPPEVTEWLKHKYVLIYLTERRFDPSQQRAKSYSTFYQIPVNRIVDTNHRFSIKETILDSEESFYAINRLAD